MKYKVIISTPRWALNGVHVQAVNLIRGLRAKQIEAYVLITQPGQRSSLAGMELPEDVQARALPVAPDADWPTRWRCMIEWLENEKPCILLPNFDWAHSAVSPQLSREVAVVGIIHSDDPARWYRHVSRMAPYWDAFVAVSAKIGRELAHSYPELGNRLSVIPNGVHVPERCPFRSFEAGAPLRLAYAGRLAQEQKRVLDLPRIMSALVERGVPARLDIIGGGPEEALLREQSRELVERGVVRFPGILSNEQVLDVFEQSDVLLLTSEYEGLPMTVLEAMGRGCIPVLTDIESGIPELVRDGHNGFCVPVGDTDAFAERLALLQRQPDLRGRLSGAAYDTVFGQGYRIEAMTERYVKLFEQVMESAQSGSFTRPRGEILPPPELMAASRSVWKRWVVGGVRSAGRRIKELLHA